MGKCAQCGDESIETEPICKPCKKPRVGFNGKNERSKYTISVDMDGVLCDFHKKYLALKSLDLEFPQSLQGFFLDLEPMPGAIEGFKYLWNRFDTYVLTRPSVWNVHCYTEKAIWVREHLGFEVLHKMVLNPQKQRNKGDFLIDDTEDSGQTEFDGTFLKFGPDDHDWSTIQDFFKRLG